MLRELDLFYFGVLSIVPFATSEVVVRMRDNDGIAVNSSRMSPSSPELQSIQIHQTISQQPLFADSCQ